MHMAKGRFDAGLAAAMLDDALCADVRVYGISGLQGSGKSTLAAQMANEAGRRGLRCVVLSIDDFYLSRARRLRLAREVHPLLHTRGPPGTHDLPLAIEVLDALRAGRDTLLPRFDKLADDRLPTDQWPRAGQVDLVLFEGWFLCTPPEAPEALAAPLNALERDEDADGLWRRWCNAALARGYPALWSRIDRLLLLQAPSFEVVPAWRWEAEQALRAARADARDSGDRVGDGIGGAGGGMDRAGIDRFVQHCERVSRQALRTLPAIADRVIALDPHRRATAWAAGTPGAPRLNPPRS
jgi:D-glycerate 3-kinase